GEFPVKHPVILIGKMITFFEDNFYKDTILRGILLLIFILFSVGLFSITLHLCLEYLNSFFSIAISSLIASMFIAHRMLYDCVKDILTAKDKKQAISMLVSRDTQDMNESDIYKAAIETYAENLSDGVVAPIFYLILFGLPGIILYKAINTMDSMVGYKNEKYENYGKTAAILDDIANYIPSRITAILIMILSKQKNIFAFYKDGKKHDSPNAGHPITAMALAIGVKLGGDTSYFGKVKHKPKFGEGREVITQNDVKNALNLGKLSKKN
ncbi:MAG: cobalamin biosynthesis protein CobD, partial [Sulfurimonas sp.]|nr:cobalamin biosynthesis protein CobD [Sulfurimonas sp.]